MWKVLKAAFEKAYKESRKKTPRYRAVVKYDVDRVRYIVEEMHMGVWMCEALCDTKRSAYLHAERMNKGTDKVVIEKEDICVHEKGTE